MNKGILFALCLLASLVVCGLYMLGPYPMSTDDDWTIALMLADHSGVGGNCLFLKSALTGFIYGLGQVIPSLDWFTVIEFSSTVMALAVILYYLVAKTGPVVTLVTLPLLVRYVIPHCTSSSNFTVVAALCAAAGLLCLFCWVLDRVQGEKTTVVPLVGGVLLMVVGFCWRTAAFLLAAPFAAVPVVVMVIRAGKTPAGLLPLAGKVGLAAALLAVGCGAVYVQDKVAWSQPGWAEWQQLSDARSSVIDYPMHKYEDVADELRAIGVSKNDYEMVSTWNTNDPDFFTAEKLTQIAEISHKKSATAFLGMLKQDVKDNLMPLLLWLLACGGCFLVVALLPGGLRNKAWELAGMVAIGGGALLIACYFIYQGRFPQRVCLSLLTLSAVACACLTMAGGALGKHMAKPSPVVRGVRAVPGALGALVLALSLGSAAMSFSPSYLGVFANPGYPVGQTKLSSYIDSQDYIFVWDTGEYSFIEEGVYDCRFLPSEEHYEHNLLLGGWTVGSPVRNAQEEQAGMTNVMRGLAENLQARLVACDPAVAQRVQIYLMEHFGVQTQIVETAAIEEGAFCHHVYQFKVQE